MKNIGKTDKFLKQKTNCSYKINEQKNNIVVN